MLSKIKVVGGGKAAYRRFQGAYSFITLALSGKVLKAPEMSWAAKREQF